jgi:hypothetical protein
MKTFKLLVLFGGMLLLAGSALGAMSPCGTDGMTVVKADGGGKYVVYAFREGPDVAFQIPGKDMSFPNGTTGPKIFTLDGVVFETLFVKTADFVKPTTGKSDMDILNAHREFDVAYIQKLGGPLQKFVELGPRERPAANGQPAFTFYLWQMIDPLKPRGPSQYFLTTVTGGEVAVLSAIVKDEPSVDVAMDAFQSYAGSFQHILRKTQCPDAAKK